MLIRPAGTEAYVTVYTSGLQPVAMEQNVARDSELCGSS